MLEWLTFLSTAGLLVVTGWYAVLTRSLARAAKDSARSAQQAAEFAAQSAAAAVAGVDVRFDASPSYFIGSGGPVELGVTLTCSGATVFVHGAALIDAYSSVKHSKRGETYSKVFFDQAGRALVAERDYPIRLHRDESLSLEVEPAIEIDRLVSIAMLTLTVRYSLGGQGDGVEREVTWHGKAGRDYESRPADA